jgi:hypothetical protein
LRRPIVLALLTVLSGFACKRRGRDDSSSSSSPAVVAPSPRGDAAPPARDAAALAPPAAPVDLLRVTEAAVTVSSAVENASDRPERLVDGDLETAWSSRTGEMERTWVEVRLPDDARVHHLELTAGYTRQTARTDLFTANVRVRRVRVSRAGQSLGEFDLDPEQRGLQTVSVAGAGGLWRIETIGLVPGTRAAWREVSLTELRVMGTPGAARRAAEQPPAVRVYVPPPGSVDATNDALRAAIQVVRHDVGGEGTGPDDEGCSGAWAEHCVRSRWAELSRALGAAVTARCPTGLEDPARAAESRWAAYTRKDARTQGDEPDPGREADADEALTAYIDSLAGLIARCPAAANLRRVQRAAAEREPAPLRRVRP